MSSGITAATTMVDASLVRMVVIQCAPEEARVVMFDPIPSDRGGLGIEADDDALERDEAAWVQLPRCSGLAPVPSVRYRRRVDQDLEAARALGGLLVVGVNSDESVRKLKGDGRPVMREDDRAECIAALEAVDVALVFHGHDVRELLKSIRPDVHAKGTDYSVDTVPERDTAREIGAEVCIVGDPKDHAAGSLIDKLRNGS